MADRGRDRLLRASLRILLMAKNKVRIIAGISQCLGCISRIKKWRKEFVLDPSTHDYYYWTVVVSLCVLYQKFASFLGVSGVHL